MRSYRGGALSLTKTGGTIVVTGPNNQEWRIPVKLDASGCFYHKFDAQTPATGDYSVKFEPDAPKAKEGRRRPKTRRASEDEATDAAQETSCGQFTFKKEAYRLPTFEVVLNAPQTVALDATFDVDLLARYFAGGLAADRPVKWRAAQFPYVFTPPDREGFLFSTDARFSGDGKFKSTAVLERDARTDAGGAARMTFDTTIEPTAQPRRYSIEATVTGDDGIDVRNVQNVIAAAAFRARREDAALCGTARRRDAGDRRRRRQGRDHRGPRHDAAPHQAQLDFDAAGVATSPRARRNMSRRCRTKQSSNAR